MGMHSIYIRQLVWPVAACLVLVMRGHIGGVATVRVLPYPAIYLLIYMQIILLSNLYDLYKKYC